METLREILIGLPSAEPDVYWRHQMVWRAWSALRPGARSGREFQFGAVSPRMVCLRSGYLERGQPSSPRDGRIRVDLVAARRDGDRMRPIDSADVEEWTGRLLEQHGFCLHRLHAAIPSQAQGVKRDRVSGRELRIRLPVQTCEMDVRIVHRARANLAWRDGIGRGKRFGFGMLRLA